MDYLFFLFSFVSLQLLLARKGQFFKISYVTWVGTIYLKWLSRFNAAKLTLSGGKTFLALANSLEVSIKRNPSCEYLRELNAIGRNDIITVCINLPAAIVCI